MRELPGRPGNVFQRRAALRERHARGPAALHHEHVSIVQALERRAAEPMRAHLHGVRETLGHTAPHDPETPTEP